MPIPSNGTCAPLVAIRLLSVMAIFGISMSENVKPCQLSRVQLVIWHVLWLVCLSSLLPMMNWILSDPLYPLLPVSRPRSTSKTGFCQVLAVYIPLTTSNGTVWPWYRPVVKVSFFSSLYHLLGFVVSNLTLFS